MDTDIFDETYTDTLKRGIYWFAMHDEFKNNGSVRVKIDINGEIREFEVKEVKK